ncbi:MAG TPA: VCBS repeat-containing protein, partial [Kofleriaceae bacterium]|nr:VCBS repeat-containing protein [Kofleriaceae bacterium]
MVSIAALCLTSQAEVGAVVAVDQGCPQTSSTTDHQGETLHGFAGTGTSGVVYDPTDHALKLNRQGGSFKAATVGITDSHNVSCSADFDGDGWTDMVVGQSGNNFIYYYRNRTFENPAPDWANPDLIRTPKFVLTTTIVPAAATGTQHAGMVCGDFDGDGRQDFFYYKASNTTPVAPAIQRMYRGNGNGTFQAAYSPMVDPTLLPYYGQTSTNAVSYDYNGDGWLDVVYGGMKTAANATGCIVALLNNCPTPHTPGAACAALPHFTVQDVITGKDFGNKGINALTAADFTGDGVIDLLAGSPSQCSNFSLWPGLPGGGFNAVAQSVPSVGGASALVSADFSLDGRPDIAWGRDGFNCTSQGGKAYYYKNNGTSTPFSGGFTTQLSEYNVAVPGTGVALTDYDLGTTLDYDHDPDHTIDAIIADGNNSGQYLLFANRVVVGQFVACGDVVSGVLDLGALSTNEMVVTAARMSPTATLPTDTSIKYYMSNEDPASWQLASPCVDHATDYCVSFPSPVGRTVRWKATMCSNATRSLTPTIADVSINFDYTLAKEHFRGGVVVDDGVAYVGAFRQPGDRGHFYAASAGLTEIYWDAGA